MEQKKVVIYSSPTCHICKRAKAYFAENNIAYEDKDVLSDKKNREEMIEKSGQMGTPVIFVGDEMMIGFDEAKFKELLSS